MKKILGCLFLLVLLPVAFVGGCGHTTSVPSGPPATPTPGLTGTATPGVYTTPQTTLQAAVNLGSAANYVVLSYTGISNSGPSTTCGGYGVYPDGQTSVTGSPAIVETCGGAIDVGDGTADTAKINLSAAYTDASTRSGGASLPAGGDVGGQTLYPGLYNCGGNLNIAQANLTLNGNGNMNSIFIFQVTNNLIIGPGRQIVLTNSAQAANVFWAVSGYCSLDTTDLMVGNIMAYTSVTLNTGAMLVGRALAENGDVTLLTNNITHP
jgi:hypothetical protein